MPTPKRGQKGDLHALTFSSQLSQPQHLLNGYLCPMRSSSNVIVRGIGIGGSLLGTTY